MSKVKEFWNYLSVRQKVLTLTAVICLILYGIITVISNKMIVGLSDQQAAVRWNEKGEAAQVSCFITNDTEIDEFWINSFENQLSVALKEAAVSQENANSRLYVDAYSSQGKITIVSEYASLDAKAIGIGGDFFLFHPLTLLDGSFFSGNDLMKDSVLLDEDSAWRLFGSNDIAGMSVTIGGIPHYIAGVFKRDEGRFYEAAGLGEALVFVSYETLSQYGESGGISAYELISANPVKGFVYNTVKEKFGLAETEMLVVENSSRYSTEALISVILDFGLRSMQDVKVGYPYWENVARGYEDVCALLLLFRLLFLTVAIVIIMTVLIVKGRKAVKELSKFLKKKISFLSFVIFLAIMLTGCNSTTGGEESAASKDYVYRVEEIHLDENEEQSFSMIKGGDGLYAYSYNYVDGETSPWIDFWSLNHDGTIKEKNKLFMDENAGWNILRPDGKGYVYVIKNVYSMEPDENGEYLDCYYLVKMTEQGEEVFNIVLNTMPELKALASDGYFYADNMLLKDNFVYVNIVGTYVKFDENGKFIEILESAEEDDFEAASLYVLENGKVAALLYEDEGVYAAYADLDKGELYDKTKLPGTSYEYSVYVGTGYDLYLVNSYGVYGYNIGDEDKTQLMNYIDSDLGVYSVFNIIPISETEFYATYDDMETGRSAQGKFTKVNPADVKDKIGLKLACTGMNWEIRTAVVKFNKSSDKYRITVEDYYSLYGSETDYMAGINRLNADIISGKIPDILLIDSSMPVDSYIAKGLLEDIKPYIEADEELDMSNYMPNIIEAFSTDGKMYRLVPSYMISTLVAKSSDVGEERGWTVQEATEVLASKPEGTEFLTYTTRDNILSSCICVGDEFIDWKTGRCSFDSDGFIKLLEFAMLFPEKIDETSYAENYWMEYESMWREGKVLCQAAAIYNFRDYNYTQQGTFGEPVTMIGYPTSDGEGAAILANMQLAMSAKSKNKDGAYEFLRYFLTDEYQGNISYGLPLSIKKLDALAEEAAKVPTYTDENGNEIESPDIFYINDMEIEIEPMTQEEIDRVKEVLYSITNVYNYDENLMQIIEEETASYFAGQKSAKEVAVIIQSRAQIYVNENR